MPPRCCWPPTGTCRPSGPRAEGGVGEARLAALAAENVLAADETPVNVLGKTAPQPAGREEKEEDPEEGRAAGGAPHVLIVRTPDGRLTWLQAIASRRKGDVAAGIPA